MLSGDTLMTIGASESTDARMAARFAALVRVSEALRTYRDAETLFAGLARELQPVVSFSFLGLALYDEESRHVRPRVLQATGEAAQPALQSFLLTHWVLEHQRPLLVPDVDEESRFPGEMAYLASLGAKSACGLPLITPTQRVGMLLAASPDLNAYHDRDISFLSLVANQVALAIADSLTVSALSATLNLERALSDLRLTLADVLDVREVFQRTSEIAATVLPHDMLALPLLSDDREHIDIYAVSGNQIELPTTVPLPEHNRPLLSADWDSVICADLQADPNEQALPPGRAGYRGRLVVPIRLKGETAGALDFFSFTPNCYSQADVVVARRIADHVALTLSHQRLAQEAQRAAEARERAAALERRVTTLAAEVDALGGHRRVIGESASWKQVLKQATQVSATDTTVLLLGESGTGKEVLARFVHRASARSGGPFVALNCAALPEPLLESELFGFERGAFTGALTAKPGQIEQASGGVLFLDEVGEMSPAVQAKFLRVLQEREFQRLGGTRVLRANVRVVAATNRNLRTAVERGVFREDLYYRLNVFEIALPPLRDRREDILPLSEAFLRDIARSFGRPPAGIAREARDRLLTYQWPGNVRELRNVLERASIVCEGGLITGEHLTFAATDHGTPSAASADASRVAVSGPPADTTDLRVLEKATIERALADAKHNKSRAAQRLGLSRKQLYVRLRQHGLE